VLVLKRGVLAKTVQSFEMEPDCHSVQREEFVQRKQHFCEGQEAAAEGGCEGGGIVVERQLAGMQFLPGRHLLRRPFQGVEGGVVLRTGIRGRALGVVAARERNPFPSLQVVIALHVIISLPLIPLLRVHLTGP